MEISLIIALVGIAGFVGFLIWLIVRIVNWDSKWPAILGMVLFAILSVGGAYTFLKDNPTTGIPVIGNILNPKDSPSESSPVGADKGLLNVSVTVPAEFFEDAPTQEELDKSVKEEKTVKSAALNEDGSVTFVMSKSQHKK